MFPDERIQKILYDYKYSSVSLENTLEKIFNTLEISLTYLHNAAYITYIEDLAWELTQYKFHRVDKQQMSKYIELWSEEKKSNLFWCIK